MLLFGPLASCAEDLPNELASDVTPPPAVDPDAAAEASSPSLSYQPCPGGYSGACATVQMPLDWNAPAGRTIPVLIDKIVSSQRPKQQIWLLQGGPGGTAAGMIPLGLALAERMPDAEVMTLEHRGVGASSRLACPKAEAKHAATSSDAGTDDAPDAEADPDASTPTVEGAGPLPNRECLDEINAARGEDLRHFTTTNAARDLARAIELTRRDPAVPVFVYGVSYGTYWVHRFLQVAPNAASGVVLDSIVTPGEQFLSTFDLQGDLAAMKVAEHCKLDAQCNAFLGPDPWARLQEIKVKADQGHCPEAGLKPRDRTRLTFLLQLRILSGYAFALFHRFDRCTAEDAAAIRTFASRNLTLDPNAALNSSALYANIAFSELWESPPPDAATMAQRFGASVFPSGIDQLAPLYASWPRYDADELVGKFATTNVPMLMLAGTLDAQTPIAQQEKFKPHFAGPKQTFVTVPNANHSVVSQSPMRPDIGSTEQRSCGFELLLSFLANPEAPIDTSCTTKIAPIEFARPADEVAYLFGTSEMWLGARRESDVQPPSLIRLPTVTRFPFGF
ncbi:MAG: alpha/beta hydrolase [Labilithrix sp.]|nr:alpha/beta hydrolase [Labilithrix sp.]